MVNQNIITRIYKCDCGASTITKISNYQDLNSTVKQLENEVKICFKCKNQIGFRDLVCIYED